MNKLFLTFMLFSTQVFAFGERERDTLIGAAVGALIIQQQQPTQQYRYLPNPEWYKYYPPNCLDYQIRDVYGNLLQTQVVCR